MALSPTNVFMATDPQQSSSSLNITVSVMKFDQPTPNILLNSEAESFFSEIKNKTRIPTLTHSTYPIQHITGSPSWSN